jgi:hypothetical protein
MGGWSHFGLASCVVTPSLNQTLTPCRLFVSFLNTFVSQAGQAPVCFNRYFNRTMAKPFKWTYEGKPLAA